MSGIGIGDGMVFVGCGRRMWVIHTLGVSSTLIHIATRFGTSQDITQRSTAQRNKKGRPAEAGLPARIFGAESLHNNIVVTVSLSNARST
ncbi:hypothetical protein GT579_15685 [Enterococcus durans]|nr:hypothetical protein [Enterococcus durans]